MPTTRTTLTKTMANAIRQARTEAGLSQYDLADKLGWVRSKIKRIEKFETQTIDEQDLEALTAALSMTAPEEVSEAPKKTKKAKAVEVETPPAEIEWIDQQPPLDQNELFEMIAPVPRKSRLKFFKVKFLRGITTRALFKMDVTLADTQGRIHGVETNAGQGSIIKTGDKLVIGIFPSA